MVQRNMLYILCVFSFFLIPTFCLYKHQVMNALYMGVIEVDSATKKVVRWFAL